MISVAFARLLKKNIVGSPRLAVWSARYSPAPFSRGFGQTGSARGPDKETHDPIAERRPEQEQMPRVQLAKQTLERSVPFLGDESAEVFHVILLPNGKFRKRVEFSQDMIDQRLREWIGKWRCRLGIVGEHITRARKPGTRFLQGQGQQSVESGRDKKIEVRDFGDLQQSRWRLKVRVAQEHADTVIDFAPIAPGEEIRIRDIIERGILIPTRYSQMSREFRRDPANEWDLAAVLLNGHQVGANNRNDLLVLDVKQKLRPIFIAKVN